MKNKLALMALGVLMTAATIHVQAAPNASCIIQNYASFTACQQAMNVCDFVAGSYGVDYYPGYNDYLTYTGYFPAFSTSNQSMSSCNAQQGTGTCTDIYQTGCAALIQPTEASKLIWSTAKKQLDQVIQGLNAAVSFPAVPKAPTVTCSYTCPTIVNGRCTSDVPTSEWTCK